MTNHFTVKDSLTRYFQDNFLVEFDQEITEDTDLFKAGVLDSFGYIQLIKYLEKEFEVTFSAAELMKVEATLNKIVEKISAKMPEQAMQHAVGEAG